MEKYHEVLPELLEGLRDGREQVELADALSERTGLSTRETYQWIQMTEGAVERFRRRRAIVTVVPIWLGGLSFCIAGLMVIMGTFRDNPFLTGLLAGGGLLSAVLFAIRGRRLQRDVHEKWYRDRQVSVPDR